MKYRIEKDTMGEVKVPNEKLWGAQTERSRKNFKIGKPASMPIEIIYGFAYLKKAAAYANHKLGVLSKASTLFGIMQVNFQQTVTLFEGPLDAKFMHNSLALATAGRSTEEFDEMATVRYMFDNDDTGKKKMAQKLKKGRPVFMWSKFLKDFKLDKYNIKDLNDLIKVCYRLKSDAWKQIDNYFTSSELDLWYV